MRPSVVWLLIGGMAVALAACGPWPPPGRYPAFDLPGVGPDERPRAGADDPAAPAQRGPRRLDGAADDEEPRRVERVVETGTGRLVGPPAGRRLAPLTRDDAGEIMLNVVDADIREVVRLVLEDGLDANYVIDPAVSGTVTVRTSRPVPAADLPGMLDSLLRINDAALVREGDLFKVVPLELAATSGLSPGIEPVAGAGRNGFGIQIVPLRYASADELAGMLERFTPPSGAIQPDSARNLLLVVGPAEQLRGLTELIETFDVDLLAGMSFGLFPVTTAAASALASELQLVFGDDQTEPASGVIRFVPIDRLNAILVITPQPAYLARAERWIDRLDRVGDGEAEQVFVYPVQNGRAADLATVLGQLFDIQSSAVGDPSLLAPGLDPAELGSSGFGQSRSGFDQSGTGFEGGQAGGGDGDSAPSARQAARPPITAFGQQPGLSELTPGRDDVATGTRIVADQTTNSLVIRASARDYRRIETALRQLDLLPLQVLIEATIAEVTLNDRLEYGVEWFFRFGSTDLRLNDTLRELPTRSFPGFSALFTSGNDIRVVIDALAQVTDVNVVSSPQLMVLDNQTAELQVGDEISIVSRQAQGIEDPDAPIIASLDRRQTGVILTVTPRVNASGTVLMEIQQEVSDVAGFDEFGQPIISQRRVASTVAVDGGETVALGGLIENSVNRGRSGLPFLSSIPVLGHLFSSTRDSAARTELLVMITPRVVRGPSEARQVTDELRRRLQGLESLRQDAPPAPPE